MLDIETINKKYLDLIGSAESTEKLDNIRLDAIGKKGEVTLLMRSLGNMEHQERLHISPLLNNLKKNIEEALLARKENLEKVMKILTKTKQKPKGSKHINHSK